MSVSTCLRSMYVWTLTLLNGFLYRDSGTPTPSPPPRRYYFALTSNYYNTWAAKLAG